MNMTDYDSDIYEHELYVIEVFSEYDLEHNNDEDYTPVFFRFYRDDCDVQAQLLEGYELEPIHRIHKTCVLSRSTLYTQINYAEEEIAKLNKIGITTQIRKVDVRLKDE